MRTLRALTLPFWLNANVYLFYHLRLPDQGFYLATDVMFGSISIARTSLPVS